MAAKKGDDDGPAIDPNIARTLDESPRAVERPNPGVWRRLWWEFKSDPGPVLLPAVPIALALIGWAFHEVYTLNADVQACRVEIECMKENAEKADARAEKEIDRLQEQVDDLRDRLLDRAEASPHELEP